MIATIFITILILGGICLLIFEIVGNNLKIDYSTLENSSTNFEIYDENGAIIYSSVSENEEIPQALKNSFIAVEDKRFYSHNGLDYRRIVSASINNIKKGYFAEGASTITQQLVKNTQLSPEKTITRKIKEAKLSLKFENEFSKDEILKYYLSKIYFGNGFYGVSNAARGYFNKSLDELSIKECAVLAGIVKNPSKYSPTKNIELCNQRANLILKLMYQQNMINSQEFGDSSAQSIILFAKNKNTEIKSYVESAVYEASKILGIDENTLQNGRYKIYTYFDPNINSTLNRELNNGVYDYSKYGITVDNSTVGITSYVSTSQLFNAFTLKRSPASLIKPFLSYLPALENGLMPYSLILDERTKFGDYEPKNFHDNYHGYVTVRYALENSLNVPAVKLMDEIGCNKCIEVANRFGLDFGNEKNLALSLGGMKDGFNAVQLCGAYTALANGYYKQPTFIKRIEDQNGRVLYKDMRKFSYVGEEDNIYLLNNMLKSTAKCGTAKMLGQNMNFCSKTGTCASNNANYNQCAYSVAYNPSVCSLIWYGTIDENQKMPSSVTGGGLPTLANRKILESLDVNYSEFAMPDSVVKLRVDKNALLNDNKLLLSNDADSIEEYFKVNSIPEELIDIKKYKIDNFEIKVDDDVEISFNSEKYIFYRIIKSGKGQEIIFDKVGNGELITLMDNKIECDEYYEYEIIPYIINFYGEEITGESKKISIIAPFEYKKETVADDGFDSYFDELEP